MDREGSDHPDDIVDADSVGGRDSSGESEIVGGGAASLDEKEAQDAADRGRDVGEPVTDPDGSADQFVESAEIQQGLDPDVLTDDQADRRAE